MRGNILRRFSAEADIGKGARHVAFAQNRRVMARDSDVNAATITIDRGKALAPDADPD